MRVRDGVLEIIRCCQDCLVAVRDAMSDAETPDPATELWTGENAVAGKVLDRTNRLMHTTRLGRL
jgi:hypothetical protein